MPARRVCVCVRTYWLFSGCTCDCVRLLPAVGTRIALHAKDVVLLLFRWRLAELQTSQDGDHHGY